LEARLVPQVQAQHLALLVEQLFVLHPVVHCFAALVQDSCAQQSREAGMALQAPLDPPETLLVKAQLAQPDLVMSVQVLPDLPLVVDPLCFEVKGVSVVVANHVRHHQAAMLACVRCLGNTYSSES
jgi:hypothetical protein